MESFYDREEGIAWGPITKQELLDDLLIYKPKKSSIRHRNTLNCNPSFVNEVGERFTDVTTVNTISPSVDNAVVISSDEEEHDDEDLLNEISDLNVCQSEPTDLKNRLPTPANIDEDTFGDSLNEEDVKLEDCCHDTPCDIGKSQVENPNVLQNDAQASSTQDISYKSDGEVCCGCEVPSDEVGTEPSSMNEVEEVFNDTLTEMERLLNEGLNYTMGTSETSSQVSPDSGKLNTADEEISHQFTPSIFLNNDKNIKAANKSSAKKKTKIPVAPTFTLNKPTSKAVLTPTNLKYATHHPSPVPLHLNRRFRDIVSPVSLYINNSGVAPLYKKVTPSKQLNINKGKLAQKQLEEGEKENSFAFPEVIYKPAKETIVRECNNFKLPKNIESLISQKPNIIKHEGRIGGGSKMNHSFISKKLCEPDSTIDSNTSLDNTGDISVHCTKRVFITKSTFK